jgi:tellurite resistance protein
MAKSTLVPGDHPLLDAPDEERKAYLIVIASMAFVDRKVDAPELARLNALCTHLRIADRDREEVLAAAHLPDQVGVAEKLARLRGSALGVAVLVDALDMACADGVVTPEESREVEELARALGVPTAQIGTIRRYVLDARGLQPPNPPPTSEVAAGAAIAGVPAAVLAVAAALGAPLAAGVGLAAALGAGGYVSVRWLAGENKRSRRG